MNSEEMSSRDRAASNAAVVATAGAILSLLPVTARQIGLIQHLPDPPGGIFDSDRITTSRMAHPFGVPDALLGLGSYGVTLGLLLAARHDGVREAAATRQAERRCGSGDYKCGAAAYYLSPDMFLVHGYRSLHRAHGLLRAAKRSCTVEPFPQIARTPFPAAMAS